MAQDRHNCERLEEAFPDRQIDLQKIKETENSRISLVFISLDFYLACVKFQKHVLNLCLCYVIIITYT